MLMAAASAIMRSSSCSGLTTSCTCRRPLVSYVFRLLHKVRKGSFWWSLVSSVRHRMCGCDGMSACSILAGPHRHKTHLRNKSLPGMASFQGCTGL